MDDLLAEFLTETNESLAELDLALVKLEQTPDDTVTLSLIFRLVHTVKGTCGFLGLPRLERVAHAGENVLSLIRDGILKVTPNTITTVLAALDQIKAIVTTLAATGAEPDGDDGVLIAALTAITDGQATPSKAVSAPTWQIAPSAAQVNTKQVAPPSVVEIQAETSAAEKPIAGQTIRVGIDILEDLMTLVSELVLTRNQLLQLARNQENASLTGPLQRLSHITSDLQEGVMKTRMQPIGHAWNKLPRIVRDLSRELNKKIDLVLLGAETELDRQVLELIKDPLTHMVRNSGDHGLETPAERRAAGKPETGRITLNAFHEGGHIVIEIADDGRGLPIDQIRAKVIAEGLATEAELDAMSGDSIQRLIFRPGFSTAASITAVSGRGVGMDVVKTNIEKIGGTINLTSRPGHGTTFTIKIPLTLAIVSALIVEAGGERFAIPQISVVELVRARKARSHDRADTTKHETAAIVEHINETPVLRLRERLLPLVKLDELLQLHPQIRIKDTDVVSWHPAKADSSLTIIITQVGSSQLGLIVDRVFDTEEIVVKPVAPVLRHIAMFSGNTILGDGSVIMILDTSGIARATGVGGLSEGHAVRQIGRKKPTDTLYEDRTAILLFQVDDTETKAVPLGLVARLENIPRSRIEIAAGVPVTQYRGRLMRLVPMSGHFESSKAEHTVLVFNDSDIGNGRDRSMGLIVDRIVDVVDVHLQIELSGIREGVLGTAIVAGRAIDVIDTPYWLMQADPAWFADGSGKAQSGSGPRGDTARLLIIEDSDFFRKMLVPVLQAAGFDVVGVPNASQALALRESGEMFHAIVSDIEMPDMNGLAFVRAIRADGAWSNLPVIALSGRLTERDIQDGREAGFTDYVQKFSKDALLQGLRQCLARHTASHDQIAA